MSYLIAGPITKTIVGRMDEERSEKMSWNFFKKGQITVFIVIGLVIILGTVLFLFYKAYIVRDRIAFIPDSVTPTQQYVQSCLDEVGKEAILFVAAHGGYYDLPDLADIELALPYYFYEEQNSMPSKQEIEEQLALYMDNELFFCLKNFVPLKGVSIEQGEIQTTATIKEDKVLFDVLFPLIIIQEDATTTLSYFSTTVSTKLNAIYDLISAFMTIQEQDTSSICISCLVKLETENNIRTEMYSIKEGVVQFSIIDEEILINDEPVTFTFLNAYPQYSCENLPPTASEEFISRCIEQKIAIYNYTVGLANIPDMDVEVGTMFTYDVNATGFNLTYGTLTNLFTINQKTGLIEFSPKEDDIGEHMIWVHIVDAFGNEDYETFTLRVTEK